MNRKHSGKRDEDYLETIFLLSKSKRIIRITDISIKLKLKKSTVAIMIEKLAKEGFLEHEKYGDVLLTQKGIEEAQKVYNKHLIFHSFLKNILHVQDKIAELDACNLEHYVSDETIDKLLKFIEFFFYITSKNKNLESNFKRYYETGKYPKTTKENEGKIKKLSSLKVMEKAKILSLNSKNILKNKFHSIGLFPGVDIEVVSKNTATGITIIKTKKTELKLDNKDTKEIIVEVI